MADYKLSELNSIDTIRSDDLLHVRVKRDLKCWVMKTVE